MSLISVYSLKINGYERTLFTMCRLVEGLDLQLKLDGSGVLVIRGGYKVQLERYDVLQYPHVRCLIKAKDRYNTSSTVRTYH